jgi:4-amino-4-deoxy-L-arabinose transferase-like glycosyltransferase
VRLARSTLWPLAAFTAYLLLAAWVPPTDDELYYWCWSRELQLSYYDHPPLTAYLIRASTTLFGDSVVAVRLPAILASVLVLGIISRLTRSRSLMGLVVLTPPFTFGAVLITPDTPLLACWAGYLLWLTRVHRRLDSGGAVPVWMWAVGGLLLGGGALGKYTIALAVPAGFASFVLSGRPWRHWLAGYLFHGTVALVAFTPVVAFNLNRGFAPLRYQWEHVRAANSPGGVGTFGEFVGTQVLLFGALPLLLFPWAVRNASSLGRDSQLRAALCLYAVPFGFFLAKAATGPLEGNWALAAYIGCWPVAGRWTDSTSRRWIAAVCFAVPVLATTILAVHLVQPIELVPPQQDRVTRQAAKVELARVVAGEVRRRGEVLPVYVPTYQWTALLRYQGIDARQLDGISRPSHFTARSEHVTDGDRAYLFSEGALPTAMTPGFAPPRIVATYPLIVRGETVSVFYLIRYERTSVP